VPFEGSTSGLAIRHLLVGTPGRVGCRARGFAAARRPGACRGRAERLFQGATASSTMRRTALAGRGLRRPFGSSRCPSRRSARSSTTGAP